jgi:hypothetical protein
MFMFINRGTTHTCGVELSLTVLLHTTKLATFLLKCNAQAFYNTHTNKPIKDFKASEDILSAKVHQVRLSHWYHSHTQHSAIFSLQFKIVKEIKAHAGL